MDSLDAKKQVPWVVFKAKNWLDAYLDRSMIVFEWGSGGSTLYFAKKVKKVISVEHVKDWHEKVSKALEKNNLKNCSYFLVNPRKSVIAKRLPDKAWAYVSRTDGVGDNRDFLFNNYVRKIDNFNNHTFDLVFVDGRSRIACVNHAIKKIKKGGYLILDNSERKAYQSVVRKLDKKYKNKHFFGNGPFSDEKWQTSIWQVK